MRALGVAATAQPQSSVVHIRGAMRLGLRQECEKPQSMADTIPKVCVDKNYKHAML
jgi:hypothetical protein